MTLVVGVGNAWRRDDAAGLVVARRLRESSPPVVRVIEHEGEPLDLIEQWACATAAVVVDAVSSGAQPGTIHRLDASQAELPAELFRGSTHALGVAEAVELGRAIDRLPRHAKDFGESEREHREPSARAPDGTPARIRFVAAVRRRAEKQAA